MAYRIVKINSRCKLETSLNYLVCRAESETRILLDEISVILIENQQACLTSALLSECMSHGIRVIFCDGKHNPQGELNPYFGCYDGLAKFRLQCSWSDGAKDQAWQAIIRQKVLNQAFVLRSRGKTDKANMLAKFSEEVLPGDPGNREGLAAKVYFQSLFGTSFDRRDEYNPINLYLNYGYSLLLSLINREISSFGYINHVGIHHIGETNPFNLGCDFVEPFRPFVDETVLRLEPNRENYKKSMLDCMSREVSFSGKKMLLQNAAKPYVIAAFSYLNGKSQEIPNLSFANGNI
ncbi:MAG: type II CRISPR-associated endonuclease Cas1 [Bacillota bacterium]|nr:type II CRISPR-associated endonuclease Cas1 [Bacillota bacterium]